MAASQHNFLVLWAEILRFRLVWLLADLLDLQGHGLRSFFEWRRHYHAQCDVPHRIGNQRP